MTAAAATAQHRRALTRQVSNSLVDCALTFKERGPIDLDRALAQHAAYVSALEALGLEVVVLSPEHSMPDGVFVEDPVVVIDECAIVMTMGAEERRSEIPSIAKALAPYRLLHMLRAPARMDGGDVLRIGRDLFVGRSARSDIAGIEQFTAIVSPLGYRVTTVDVPGCLHLKTGCTFVGKHLLINREWVDAGAFKDLPLIAVPESEPWAANTLPIGNQVLVSASHRETAKLLERHGYASIGVDISELEKAEAGLTCLSVLFYSYRKVRVGPETRWLSTLGYYTLDSVRLFVSHAWGEMDEAASDA